MNKPRQTFSFIPPINLIKGEKWLPKITSFECTNSVFIITDENNNFSYITPGHWSSRGVAEIIIKLQRLIQPRSQDDIKINVEEVRKRENRIKLGDKEYKLSEFDTQKEEVMEELQKYRTR